MRNIPYILLLLFSFPLFSQEEADTSVLLSEVTVVTTRLKDFAAGMHVITFDSLTMEQYRFSDLGKLLATSSLASIKAYGAGGLATITSRGTSANHTGLFWNGININFPNLGLSDLSLLPVLFFDNIEMQQGGASSLFGSGNIGGSVQMNTKSEYNKGTGTSMAMSAGSFGYTNTLASFEFSGEKIYTHSTFNSTRVKNDYTYNNYVKFESPSEKLKNAALSMNGIMQEIGLRLKNNQYIDLSLWYQGAYREIPATLTSAPGEASQDDESLRSLLNYRNFLKKGNISIKAAWLLNDMHYKDPETATDAKYQTTSLITRIEGVRYIGKHAKIQGGIDHTHIIADIDAYKQVRFQNQLALFLLFAAKLPVSGWKIAVNMRQELIGGYQVPFTPSAGAEGKIWRFIFGRLNISKNFRVPTLNDRFWIPGGRDDLKPEKGWNEEAGIIFKTKDDKLFYNELSITLYNALIDCWILWIPQQKLWIPANIQKVWTRGLEINEAFKIRIKNHQVRIYTAYAYTLSTNEKKTAENDLSYQKQLIYVPRQTGFVNMVATYRSYQYSYRHVFTGLRYVNSANSAYVNGYDTGELCFQKTIEKKSYIFNFRAEIRNLWNKEYQVIQYMPMPGRAVYFSLIIGCRK